MPIHHIPFLCISSNSLLHRAQEHTEYTEARVKFHHHHLHTSLVSCQREPEKVGRGKVSFCYFLVGRSSINLLPLPHSLYIRLGTKAPSVSSIWITVMMVTALYTCHSLSDSRVLDSVLAMAATSSFS